MGNGRMLIYTQSGVYSDTDNTGSQPSPAPERAPSAAFSTSCCLLSKPRPPLPAPHQNTEWNPAFQLLLAVLERGENPQPGLGSNHGSEVNSVLFSPVCTHLYVPLVEKYPPNPTQPHFGKPRLKGAGGARMLFF